ncbi:GPI ethanolamine phosphate transferase 3 isoform X2 [Oryza brachyantha]|uniref:GPI ethanolamine phosphate transferase 3 isoform X2 n=1 Tax=Oryza brachyantha TaxID=4533 RepID=UPI000776922E|nr:GPI ethanolamine phosphate transferase 3 isoform X2 [Oryza brachyantha]
MGTLKRHGCRRTWSLLFFAILMLHSLAIYLFTRGFLLTRTELDVHSHQDDHTGIGPGCSSWPPPAVDRLVIVVLDALRFDFVAPSTFFQEKQPWMDKLKVLQKLAADEKTSARIFKALADPPTTSLQRLKALTTGGLPTFIDVGNSFGAPAIAEDNIMHQFIKNGKRVVMMGDDTWIQLYPDHFNKSYPYPSFNVKDLDTVDNGVIEHLLPSLRKTDWDVLIAHFLGVDHAGHIFGVDSTPMIQKLEQYNQILEDVIDMLKSLSTPGGPHENTLLLVMGDHGQTLNGDHGGGTAEEVETSLFAWSPKTPPNDVLSVLGKSSCNVDLHGKEVCVSTMQQLDFAVTVAALLGIPFPFGSIGRVNQELYALSAGTWDYRNDCTKQNDLVAWMQRYAEALCVNCWQVKRYIDLYSASSVIGFRVEDLNHVADLYSKAQANWSSVLRSTCPSETGSQDELKESVNKEHTSSALRLQIDAYSDFLESFAKLARSAWTEFDLWLMGIGLSLMILSVSTQACMLMKLNTFNQTSDKEIASSSFTPKIFFAFALVAIRAASFLSNSYILAEGRVGHFLLATSCIANVWHSATKGTFVIEEFAFLLLNILIRFGIEFGMSKQISGAIVSNDHPVSIICGLFGSSFCSDLMEIFPIISLTLLVCIILKCLSFAVSQRFLKYFVMSGSILSYTFIAIHWASESSLFSHAIAIREIGISLAPRLVYAIGGLSLVISLLYRLFGSADRLKVNERITSLSTAMLCSWSPTILLLLGRQGPFVALICMTIAWCIIKLQQKHQREFKLDREIYVADYISVTQWSLLAVCLFYLTGHWCTFDGLRYGAAFIGFDHFQIIRQGLLLSIDTFGVSHILPVFSLPFIAICWHNSASKNNKVLLIYGLITSTTTTLTIICVTIQRRHLMVWGLFAPKYVFDAIGLLLTDLLVVMASLYYS